MNVNFFFPHISLLTNTRAICITVGIVVMLRFGEASTARQDARPTNRKATRLPETHPLDPPLPAFGGTFGFLREGARA